VGLYRYGFNGKEKDDEGMGGGGSTYDYGFRIYNPQIAKFLSVDPLTRSYPELTPYQFASNTPIMAVDLDGLEAKISIYGNGRDKEPTLVITDAKEIKEFMTKNSLYGYYNGPTGGRANDEFEVAMDGDKVAWVNVKIVSSPFHEPKSESLDQNGEHREKGWVPESDGQSEGDGPIGDNPAYIHSILMNVVQRIYNGPGYEVPEDPAQEVKERIDQIKEYSDKEAPTVPEINPAPTVDTTLDGNWYAQDGVATQPYKVTNRENGTVKKDTVRGSVNVKKINEKYGQ
jgi:RHS repeat-associated protein